MYLVAGVFFYLDDRFDSKLEGVRVYYCYLLTFIFNIY